MKNSRMMNLILIGMGLFTLGIVGVAVYLIGSGSGLLAAEPGTLHAYVQAEPVVYQGKETYLVVTVQNDTQEYVSVDEIRLSNSLLASADVAAIVPGTLTHTDYEMDSGYQIGFLVAPGAQQQFTITLLPRQVDDLVGDVTVIAGERTARTGFRLIIQDALAALPPTATLAPPTPTWPPTASVDLPTATPTLIPLPYSGVVKITAKIKYSSYLKPIWSGSGTIISADGLILTNAHLITPDQEYRPDMWVISITDDPALPPQDLYYAEPLVMDEDLDIAVMHITSELNYKPIKPADLGLTVIPLGDSDLLQLGESLSIVGYPGIGGETITLTRGDVGGFTASNQYGERSFVKTSAAISGGTSGGTALDASGRMVAIPTQLGYGGRGDDLVDCRVIVDTNGDGSVDSRDACVPVGGFINAMRPVNLARPLIDQAKAIVNAVAPLFTATP